MKNKLILGVILLGLSALQAQEKKEMKVRIKKVENINGVEKVTDTTFTTNDASWQMKDGGDGSTIDIIETLGAENDGTHKVIITEKIIDGDAKAQVQMISGDEKLSEEIEKAMKDAGVSDEQLKHGTRKMVFIQKETEDGGEHGKESKSTKIVIIKRVNLTEPSTEDTKMLNKTGVSSDGKLKVEHMNFFPNPNNGKFKLSFDLSDKGTTDISVMNVEGKQIYNEKLNNFTGHYEKEIDISNNPKGVYFIKVSQGKHAQLKKIVLE